MTDTPAKKAAAKKATSKAPAKKTAAKTTPPTPSGDDEVVRVLQKQVSDSQNKLRRAVAAQKRAETSVANAKADLERSQAALRAYTRTSSKDDTGVIPSAPTDDAEPKPRRSFLSHLVFGPDNKS